MCACVHSHSMRFLKLANLLDMIHKVSSINILHDEVQSVLEAIKRRAGRRSKLFRIAGYRRADNCTVQMYTVIWEQSKQVMEIIKMAKWKINKTPVLLRADSPWFGNTSAAEWGKVVFPIRRGLSSPPWCTPHHRLGSPRLFSGFWWRTTRLYLSAQPASP